jgi:hypothetical protein
MLFEERKTYTLTLERLELEILNLVLKFYIRNSPPEDNVGHSCAADAKRLLDAIEPRSDAF